MKQKVVWTLGVLFLAAALLTLPGPAKAEMYVEAYFGLNTASSFDTPVSVSFSDLPNVVDKGTLPGGPNAAIIGGLKIGTWFVPTGFLGCNYPDWAKYFGFYTDFSFHRLDARRQQLGVSEYDAGVLVDRFRADFLSEGTVATWAFMFAARYGFFPDSEVPFGRLQPYVAVGPAVMWSTQQPKLISGLNPGSASSTNIALAVDAGLRYMCLKNVSLDLSFKYRYAQPSYSYSQIIRSGEVDTTTASFTYKPTYNLFSLQLGAAYHF
jgi:opacity protein-like surface antigen